MIDFLNEKNVNFVAKTENPPNVPECRVIEDFWSILKGEVYKHNWKAKDLKCLQAKINLSLKKVDPELVKALARSTRLRVGCVRTKNVIEFNN